MSVRPTRIARWNYLNGKWGQLPIDGRPWDWERADGYAGPGRYSLRAVVELAKPPGDAFTCKLPDHITRGYLMEPV